MNEQEYNDLLQKQTSNYIQRNGKLYRKRTDGKELRVIKQNEMESILFMCHDHPTGGHFGVDATYNKIKERFYWAGMKTDIKNYIKKCDACQRRGQKGGETFLHPIKVTGPFERIGIDFVGPLTRTRKRNKYILVITDYLTKWPEAKAMREATAKNVVQFLYEGIICRHGCPKIILSDRGTHFKNELVEQLCDKFKINHKLSSPYHPQTNGLVERFNRTLCESLAKVIERENQWDEYIESVLFAYRTTKHSTIGQTPFYMMYGREAVLPIDEIDITNNEAQNNQQYNRSLLKRTYEIIDLEQQQKEVIKKIEKSQVKQKERYDKKIQEVTFTAGTKVLLKDMVREKSYSGKLRPKWKGPYYIHEVIGKGAYKIRNTDGRVLKAPYNVKQLKEYFD